MITIKIDNKEYISLESASQLIAKNKKVSARTIKLYIMNYWSNKHKNTRNDKKNYTKIKVDSLIRLNSLTWISTDDFNSLQSEHIKN